MRELAGSPLHYSRPALGWDGKLQRKPRCGIKLIFRRRLASTLSGTILQFDKKQDDGGRGGMGLLCVFGIILFTNVILCI